MNIDEYIASGILEQYVTGSASPQEMREVECMSHIYPEINAEVSRLQLAIEQYAKSHSKRPPAHLRNTILAKLKTLEDETPKPVVEPANNVIEFSKPKTNTSIWKYSAAASFILLAVSSAYFINNQNKKNKEIAEALGLNEKTISTYKLRLLAKLNVTNLVDLVNKAKTLEIV